MKRRKSGDNSSTPYFVSNAKLLKIIFRYLPQEELVNCSLVCKKWLNVSVDPVLWKTMDCAEMQLTAPLVTAILKRQPEHLILDWTQIDERQLEYVITRLPGLKNLSLQSSPVAAVLVLHTSLCPPLQVLNLSFVSALNDDDIRYILSPPKDSILCRLSGLKTLKIAYTNISDVALRYITQSLPHLIHLDVSSCEHITDSGVAQIGTSPSAIANLVELNLSKCRYLSDLSLDHLANCEQLIWLDLRNITEVSTQAVLNFAFKSKQDLCVKQMKLIEKRKIPR